MKKKSRREKIREEILREWRGAEKPESLDDGIHAVSEFVANILRSAGLEDGLNENEVRSAWKDLAGDFIASHTRPLSVKGGHLVLQVTQPSMRFHLEQMKPMLLQRIQARLGPTKIRSIKFGLG